MLSCLWCFLKVDTYLVGVSVLPLSVGTFDTSKFRLVSSFTL